MAARKALTTLNQFPLWSEHLRGLPHTFVRSALFTVGGKHERRTFSKEVVASMADTELRYTGEELRIDDQDVIAQLFHLARGAILNQDTLTSGIQLEFSGHSFLRELDWQVSAKGYTKLKASLARLQAGSLTVVRTMSNGRKKTFAGQIIRKFVISEEGDFRAQWKVWLEPEVLSMFISFLELEWAVRTRLSRPLSKWLHSLISGEPDDRVFMICEELLMELTGSQASNIRKFRQTLKEGLLELIEEKAIHDWKLDKGFLYVAKVPGIAINRAALAAFGSTQLQLDESAPEEEQAEATTS